MQNPLNPSKSIGLNNFFELSKPLLVPCFHILILILVYKLLFLSRVIAIIDPFFLKQWDASFYAAIAEQGYQFTPGKAGNTAFFPLFPYIWKLLWKITGAGIEGVCFYNLIAFLLGMLILKKTYHFSWMYFLLFLSIPSNMFMYVPYSEATFFFFSALVLAGLKMNNKKMVLTGLFFASLTRPSGAFFIPAIIAMEFIMSDAIKGFFKNVLTYSAVSLLAILFTFIIQYHATGVWLVFFKDGWTREMNFPHFPLTTWGGLKNLWLDGLALLFGLLAALILLILLFCKLKKKEFLKADRSEIFSLTYVLMALATILFFGGRDAGEGSSLLSLNRFLMATPFFTIMLHYLSHRIQFTWRTFFIYSAVVVLTLLALNLKGTGYSGYNEKERFWYIVLLFVWFMLYMILSKKFENKYLVVVYLLNLVLQVALLHRFAYSGWVG